MDSMILYIYIYIQLFHTCVSWRPQNLQEHENTEKFRLGNLARRYSCTNKFDSLGLINLISVHIQYKYLILKISLDILPWLLLILSGYMLFYSKAKGPMHERSQFFFEWPSYVSLGHQIPGYLSRAPQSKNYQFWISFTSALNYWYCINNVGVISRALQVQSPQGLIYFHEHPNICSPDYL